MRIKKNIPIKSKPTFAIVADGECEVWYFQMLKRNERKINVNIEPKIPQNKKISEQYDIVKSLSIDYTKVFWIIDFDVIIKETKETKKGNDSAINIFKKYYNKIFKETDNVIVIINTPCLEYWILLHYSSTSKYFEKYTDLLKELKKYLKDYKKSKDYYTKQDNDIYLRLKPMLLNAIENSKKLGSFNCDNYQTGMSEMHYFFEVDELIKHFKDKA